MLSIKNLSCTLNGRQHYQLFYFLVLIPNQTNVNLIIYTDYLFIELKII